MREKKHIDRLFQEKFKDFEVSPKERVWKNIEKELKRKKRKPFILPLWYKIAGAAAVLTVIFLLGNLLFDNSRKPNIVNIETEIDSQSQNSLENKAVDGGNTITSGNNKGDRGNGKNEVTGESPTIKLKNSGTKAVVFQENPMEGQKLKTNAPITSQGTSNHKSGESFAKKKKTGSGIKNQKNPAYVSSVKKDETNPQNETATKSESKGFLFQKDPIADETEKQIVFVDKVTDHLNKNEISLGKKNKNKFSENKKSLLEVAAVQNQAKEKFEEALKNNKPESAKWQISPFVAPIYYGSFGAENTFGPNLAQNKSEGEITMAYGVNFAYKLSERLKVRSGISQVSMGYNVDNIAFVSVVRPASLTNNMSYSSELGVKIVNRADLVVPSGEIAGRSAWTPGTLNQQIGFIEVPIEIEYSLIDKKFDLSVIGGASTLFLDENNIIINTANGTTNVGEANNLNHVSFSTNIGLGIGYDITDQFEISVEPMFKYQLNTFSGNSNDFNPYYMGIYTGFSFQF